MKVYVLLADIANYDNPHAADTHVEEVYANKAEAEATRLTAQVEAARGLARKYEAEVKSALAEAGLDRFVWGAPDRTAEREEIKDAVAKRVGHDRGDWGATRTSYRIEEFEVK